MPEWLLAQSEPQRCQIGIAEESVSHVTTDSVFLEQYSKSAVVYSCAENTPPNTKPVAMSETVWYP